MTTTKTDGSAAVQPKSAAGVYTTLKLDKITNADNPRSTPSAGELAELRDSIQERGVLQPIGVRQLKGERYSIVFGGRRWAAAKLAGHKFIPCTLLDVDKKEARELALIENLQRTDLDPLDEAAAIDELAKGGLDTRAIAKRLGKTVRFVGRRRQLVNLAPVWVKGWSKGDLKHWTPEMLDELALLDHELQADFWGDRDFLEGVSEIRSAVQDVCLELARAPFALDDETLLPTAGACTSCHKHTGARPGLFDDDATEGKPDTFRCLDSTCWLEKLGLHRAAGLKAAKATHGAALVLVHGQYDSTGADGARERRRGQTKKELAAEKTTALGKLRAGMKDLGHGWAPSKQKAAGAVPAFVQSGKAAGKVVWVSKGHGTTGRGTPRKKPAPAKTEPAAVRLKASLERVRDRRRGWIVDRVRDWLEKGMKETRSLPAFLAMKSGEQVATAAALAYTFGLESHGWGHRGRRQRFGTFSAAHLMGVVVPKAASCLVRHGPQGLSEQHALALWLSDLLLGVAAKGSDSWAARALAEIPDPAVVAKLRREAAAKPAAAKKGSKKTKKKATVRKGAAVKRKAPTRSTKRKAVRKSKAKRARKE